MYSCLKKPKSGSQQKSSEWRIRAFLGFLAEFYFSTFKLFEEGFGGNRHGLNKLLKDGLVSRVKNDYYNNEYIYFLTLRGMDYIGLKDRAIRRRANELQLKKYMYIVHDLQIQLIVLKRIESINYFVFDKSCEQYLGDVMIKHLPDLIVGFNVEEGLSRNIAFEYERTPKNISRVEYILLAHLVNMRQGKYFGVIYWVDNQADYEFYKKITSQTKIDIRFKNRKTGKFSKNGEVYNLSDEEIKKITVRLIAEDEMYV